MTKQEKIIVSAYTGMLMCDFGSVHKYIEKKLGRPVYTHELANKNIQKEIEEKSKEDFLKICKQEEPERMKGKWIRITQGATLEKYMCPFCHRTIETYGVEELLKIRYPYCHCGADMRGEE